MSDGLATLIEVESTLRRQGQNMFHGKPTLASLAIAQNVKRLFLNMVTVLILL